MAKYQAYPKYYATNVEGLEQLPSLWELKQVRYLLKAGSEGTKIGPFGSALKLEDMVDEGIQVYGQENVIKRDFSLGKRRISLPKFKEMIAYEVFFGDVLITMMGTSGKCEIVPHDAEKGIIDSHLLRVRVNSELIAPSFFKILIDESSEIEHQIKTQGKGSIMLGLNSGVVKSLYLPVPSIGEQKNILRFLDHETAKIDNLIEKQQQLIELLKEKRQAVISHAVTKGLNPNVPMKDSGVEWLGEVPEHWDEIKLKYITTKIIDAEHKTAEYCDDGEYLVCRTTNVKNGKLNLDGGLYTNLDTYTKWIKRGKPEAGDILFTREAPAGEACVYSGDIPLCLGQRMVLFKLNLSRVVPEFVLHSIYSGLSDDFVKQLSQGSTVSHFNMADIQNIPLHEPPISEQYEIKKYLECNLTKYDNLITSAQNMILLMQERRTALISAAVTGKIDVRNWVAPEGEKAEVSQEATA